ncbi:carboxypeptidase A1-like [Rhinophrynus dorsalis]
MRQITEDETQLSWNMGKTISQKWEHDYLIMESAGLTAKGSQIQEEQEVQFVPRIAEHEDPVSLQQSPADCVEPEALQRIKHLEVEPLYALQDTPYPPPQKEYQLRSVESVLAPLVAFDLNGKSGMRSTKQTHLKGPYKMLIFEKRALASPAKIIRRGMSCSGDQVLRVKPQDYAQLRVLKQLEYKAHLQIDFWLPVVKTKVSVDIRVPFSSLKEVKNALALKNISYSITIDDVQALVDQEKQEMKASRLYKTGIDRFSYSTYHTLDEIYIWADRLTKMYPGLIRKIHIGQSYEGRPIYALKFSTGKNKPAIWINTGIHAREWISPATMIWTAKKIASSYHKDPSLTSILNKLDIFIEFVCNPDGYAYSHSMDRLWRKNRSITEGSPCVGVDLNRNWDVGYGGVGSSTNPCSATYLGKHPLSEPEVKSIMQFILSHGNVKALFSIHSYSQKIMFPYGYSQRLSPDHKELTQLAKKAVTALSSLHGTRYKYGTTFNTLYRAPGTITDWGYKNGIKYSYTIELRDTGKYGFLLPAEQIIPTAEETWLALMKMMEHVRDHPYDHVNNHFK